MITWAGRTEQNRTEQSKNKNKHKKFVNSEKSRTFAVSKTPTSLARLNK
jgi:hypothetical protein